MKYFDTQEINHVEENINVYRIYQRLSEEDKPKIEKDLASIEKNNPRLFSAVFGIGRYY